MSKIAREGSQRRCGHVKDCSAGSARSKIREKVVIAFFRNRGLNSRPTPARRARLSVIAYCASRGSVLASRSGTRAEVRR